MFLSLVCRQAVVDALANAPSLIALGNAGIGALQVWGEPPAIKLWGKLGDFHMMNA